MLNMINLHHVKMVSISEILLVVKKSCLLKLSKYERPRKTIQSLFSDTKHWELRQERHSENWALLGEDNSEKKHFFDR